MAAQTDVPSGLGENKNLAESCENATELVTFLSSTGNLPEDLATAEFFEILEKARLNNLAPKEEQIFWNGYSKLALHAKPTQIESLQFRNYLLGRRKVGSATEREYLTNLKSIKRIRLYSIFSFIFTLILLTYVSLTSSYMTSNKALTDEFRFIESGNYSDTRLDGLQERNRRSPVNAGNQGGSEGSDSGFEGTDFTQPTVVDPLFQIQRTEALEEIINHLEYNLGGLQFLQAYTATVEKPAGNETNERISYREGLSQRVKIEAHQTLINLLISSYFLPVFTSLLGVTVFILRRTSSSLNSGQYRLYESGTYSYRLTLGIVGGIVISWFTTRDNSGVVSSLTPAALAFVIGYSIEVLYNLLDSIVKALGASDKEAV